MLDLQDRINRVINSPAFIESLARFGIELFEFQCDWPNKSRGIFKNLPKPYQEAILAGEREMHEHGTLVHV
jgi:hypothetical protein